MVNCPKAKHLSHEDWLECQFKEYRKKRYRDVILHVSIIESAIIVESKLFHPFPCPGEKTKHRTFSRAIKILEENRKNNRIVKKEIKTIKKCWKKRCNLVHGIIEKKLDQDNIEKLIDELHNLIFFKVHKSKFFNKIFQGRGYPFSPSNISTRYISRKNHKISKTSL